MRRAAPISLAVVAVFCFAASAQAPVTDAHLGVPEGGGPIDPGPVPAGIDSIDAAACGECHRRHYREWRGSAHHTSFTNPLFQAEWGPRRRPFCAGCHAPREDEEAGIDCAVCHVRDGAVLNPTVSGEAPHVSRVAEAVGGTLACARCHQFEFDRQPGDLLQRTVDEWMSSEHNDTTCQGCHVPARGRRHAHDFPGGLDRRMLRDAIAVTARAEAGEHNTVLHLELSADGAGHAVPTGDIFRHVEVRAWPVGHRERAESALLSRRFRVDRDGWHELEDRRIPATGSYRLELELDGVARRVAYTIDLWRAPPRRVEQQGWNARDLRRRLHTGSVRVTR